MFFAHILETFNGCLIISRNVLALENTPHFACLAPRRLNFVTIYAQRKAGRGNGRDGWHFASHFSPSHGPSSSSVSRVTCVLRSPLRFDEISWRNFVEFSREQKTKNTEFRLHFFCTVLYVRKMKGLRRSGRHLATSPLVCPGRLRNEGRNSLLKKHHYSDLKYF